MTDRELIEAAAARSRCDGGEGAAMTDRVHTMTPKHWRGPTGACMPAEYFVPWASANPDDARGWEPLFTADQVAEAVAAERERIASFHFNPLDHEALSAITLDADLSDTRARLSYARKVADAVARSFAWQLKQACRKAFEQNKEPR